MVRLSRINQHVHRLCITPTIELPPPYLWVTGRASQMLQEFPMQDSAIYGVVMNGKIKFGLDGKLHRFFGKYVTGKVECVKLLFQKEAFLP